MALSRRYERLGGRWQVDSLMHLSDIRNSQSFERCADIDVGGA
jgi:hypothetical protein